MTTASLLDEPVYSYRDIDRLAELRPGTARRWINGYERNGVRYDPILRVTPQATEWATWGEFVEVRILAEFRSQKIPTARTRQTVEDLREIFGLRYPLAYLRPYLDYQHDAYVVQSLPWGDDSDGQTRLLDRQLLLGDDRSWSVISRARLSADEQGEKYASELTPDAHFDGIVVSPQRVGGQPTFTGRRITIATIAGMAAAGERHEDLAVGYGLSLSDVNDAIKFAEAHDLLSAA